MIRLYALLFSLFLGQTVFAEDLQSIDNLQQFASLIRWSGVAFSLFIIIGAWLFLRFIQSIVDGVSSQFAQRRMLMQKLQSFF
ncbi:mechanosensitive ion channel family protein, partial [Aliivibrio sp. SR45-2]|nr:mechanosensitive ion channel family protein [Aliivibrio sp. SR45-2]